MSASIFLKEQYLKLKPNPGKKIPKAANEISDVYKNVQEMEELQQKMVGYILSRGKAIDNIPHRQPADAPWYNPPLISEGINPDLGFIQWPDTPDLAFFCSHGRTGNRWLGQALNLHPDIICGVGPQSPPVVESLKHILPNYTQPNATKNLKKFFQMTMNQLVEEMRDLGQNSKFYARVHCINAFELYHKMAREKCKYRIHAVNTIRHPITRVNSYYRQWLNYPDMYLQKNMYVLWNTKKHFLVFRETMHKAYPALNLDEPQYYLFIIAVHWLWNDMMDFTIPIRHYRYEDITSSRENFISSLKFSFGRDFPITEKYIQELENLKPANRQTDKQRCSVEVYAKWENWQRYAFEKFLDNYRIVALFQQFNYDFSFIPSGR